MLVILDTLATRRTAGEWQVLLDGNGKANLEKKASPVSIHLRETHAAQDSPVNSARIAYNTQAKQDPHREHAKQGRGYTLEVTKERMRLCCRMGKT